MPGRGLSGRAGVYENLEYWKNMYSKLGKKPSDHSKDKDEKNVINKFLAFLEIINSVKNFNQKNQILGSIFNISKNLNTSYNNFIIEKLDTKYIIETIQKLVLSITILEKNLIASFFPSYTVEC